jgi:molybdate transport system regulatory protein
MSARRKRPAALPAGLKVKSKVWLELDGRAVFGDGKARMLERIAEEGSLTSAAKSLGMSYRGLWGRLREMERRLGVSLLARKAGGLGGGGTQLTEHGLRLLRQYQRFRDGINALVDERFGSAFDR